MKTQLSPRRTRGFTLIELLVVITIIVILAGLSMGGYSYIARKQAEEQTRLQISLLSKALEEYKLDNGEYPDTAGGNLGLFTKLYGEGATATPPGKIYLTEFDPKNQRQGWIEPNTAGTFTRLIDPWGNDYIYRRGDDPSSKNPDFDIASKGKDGVINTPDDIDNY